MNAAFHCGDHEALVAYLYDECEPGDRDDIAAHVARCASCAKEIASLRVTRTVLAAWTPPEASLGFQITRTDAREPLAFTPRTRPAGPWWREPLPAWAQVAAAGMIFAAGLTAGSMGRPPARDAVATAPVQAPIAERTVQTVTEPVSATELARLERRLSALESRPVRNVSASAAPAARSIDEQAILARAQALVDERLAASEERLRTDIAVLADATSNVDAQYRQLVQKVNRSQGVTIEDLQQSRAPVTSLGRRVSFQGR